MKTEDIAEKIQDIDPSLSGSAWGFEFLKCFQGKDSKLPKSTLDRVIEGSTNFAENKENEILYKKRIYLLDHDVEGILSAYCKDNNLEVAKETRDEDLALYAAKRVKANHTDSESEKIVPESLKGIAGSSAFSKLMGGADKDRSLFGGRFANKPKKEQVMPDYVAKRKDCTDFDKYRPFFETCLDELKSGIRKAIPFKNETHIEAGKFYVLGGLLCYVADKGKPYKHKGKKNTRLRLIFINERESDMLMRSLATELYKGGLMITENESDLFPDNKITPEDQETGWIYVLKSLSDDAHVQAIPNLFKIGFTSKSVEKRIAGAENQVTYLMAPVEISAKAKITNVSSHALEQLIHAVFELARLEIEVTDSSGRTKNATEWFSVPWEAIEQAIQLITLDQIQYYYYDPSSMKLEFRK